MKLIELSDGQKFRLKRTGERFKRIYQSDSSHVYCKPIGHKGGMVNVIGEPLPNHIIYSIHCLHAQCAVIPE